MKIYLVWTQAAFKSPVDFTYFYVRTLIKVPMVSVIKGEIRVRTEVCDSV